MSYYSCKADEVFINSKEIQDIIKDEIIVLVDGGAAGKLSEPFNAIAEYVSAVRFEPRGEDIIYKSKRDICINGGLWNEDIKKILYMAKEPSTSSTKQNFP